MEKKKKFINGYKDVENKNTELVYTLQKNQRFIQIRISWVQYDSCFPFSLSLHLSLYISLSFSRQPSKLLYSINEDKFTRPGSVKLSMALKAVEIVDVLVEDAKWLAI